MRRRRIGISLVITTLLVLGSVMPTGAQSAKDVSESLCTLFNRKQLRTAAGRAMETATSAVGSCAWGLTDPGRYGAQFALEARWEPVAFDDLPLFRSGGEDLTVGGRRGRFEVKPGQVMGRRGVELKDIDNQLALDLEQGTLLLRLIDGKARDRRATLAGLGELAVAKDGRLVAPPARDATLEAQFPETIGRWRTLVRDVPYPAEALCRQCESGKALRAALEAQGKTLADVTMLSATAVDPENVIENAFNEPAIQALRVAGGDASQLVEPVITYLFEGSSAEATRVDGDGIVAVSRPPDEYNFGWTAFVYPEADTVWVATSYGAVPTELLAALPGAPTPPPVTAPRPTPATDASTPEGWARSTVPSEFRGEPVRVEALAVYDDGSSPTKQLKRELRKQDKSLADVSQILAFTPSGYQLQGMRVANGDASALLGFLLASGRQAGTFGDQDPVETVIAGKSVRSFEGPLGTVHIYPGGEVIWLVMGSAALAGEWLTALP